MLDTIKGSFYGALIGDALGVPYEFHYFDIPPRIEIEMEPPATFRRSHAGTPIGTWSDDGALLLALTASLAKNPSLDLEAFTNEMCNFRHRGAYAVDCRVFDIGFQTQQGLAEYEAGTSCYLSGGADERDNGNGSLMRVLPVSFLVCKDEETARIAMEQGLPTHRHIRSQLVCALYALLLKRVAIGLPFSIALDSAIGMMYEMIDREHLLQRHHEEEVDLITNRIRGEGTGYVLDTFWSAVDCVEQSDTFEDCIKAAVALGNDTDTTACVAGGLAGAMYGYSGIPQRWLEALRWKDFAENIISNFLGSVRAL